MAGRYRLDELIAEGGFAQVFRAYDRELQRTVALKLPKASRLESTDAFLAEARRVARLKHPGMVQVYDVSVDGSSCFIVSEYIEGGTLADRLTHTQPAKEQVVRWVADIADALEYAHLHGVIHRDIKPANILIDHHGRALLADFGIAQSASKTGKFAPSLGTLRYMSPEQLEGKPSDHRSDIYSLAVVLHEALTGHLPYSSVEPNVLRKEIVIGPQASCDLPPDIRKVCSKALRKSLHERQPSAAQFAAELRRATASPRRSASGHLLMLGLGAAILLATASTLSPWLRTPPTVPHPARTPTVPTGTEERSKPQLDWPALPPLLLDKTATNSVGMKLIRIPAGALILGSPTHEAGRDKDEAEVRVEISKPFWMGETEVTLDQWREVMKGFAWPAEEQTGECALSHATWDHANLFCEWLTKRERDAGLIGQETFYRLPTEAEWEYAARCGRPGAYCFGDDPKDLSDYGWWGCESENGNSPHQCYSHPVAKKKPNKWGLYDMHGNLWEWCSDRYGPTRPGGIDPRGPEYGRARVLKGGSYQDDPASLRSANRHPEQHDHHWPYIGFRVVREGE